MDDFAFDRLTRLLCSSKSRRHAVRAVLGALLGGALPAHRQNVLADAGTDKGKGHDSSDGNDSKHGDVELSEESVGAGGGRGIGNLGGGRSGGNRRGRNHNGGNNRGGENQRKRKRDDTCAKAGQFRKDGKPCCNGLYRDIVGRCIKRQSSDDSPGGGDGGGGSGDGGDKGGGGGGGGCDPGACPSDPTTGDRGFCCTAGFCSCGRGCCEGPDCWIYSVNRPVGDDFVTIVSELCAPPTGCVPCLDSGDSCCLGCNENGSCIDGGQRFGATIRRR